MFPHLVTATDVPTLCKIDDVNFDTVDAGGWGQNGLGSSYPWPASLTQHYVQYEWLPVWAVDGG